MTMGVSILKNHKGIMRGFPSASANAFRIEIFLFIPKDSLQLLPDEDADLADPVMMEKIKEFYSDKNDFCLEDLLTIARAKDDFLNVYLTDLNEDFEDYVYSLADELEAVGLVPMVYCTLLRGAKMNGEGQFLDLQNGIINVTNLEDISLDFDERNTAERSTETKTLLDYLQKNYVSFESIPSVSN